MWVNAAADASLVYLRLLLRAVFPSCASDSCQFDQTALNKAVHNILSKPAKALLLLLKIQFSTATSSLLFPTQSSAAPTHLLCSLSLSPLFSSNVFSLCSSLSLSLSVCLSCELLNLQYLSRDTPPFSLILSVLSLSC